MDNLDDRYFFSRRWAGIHRGLRTARLESKKNIIAGMGPMRWQCWCFIGVPIMAALGAFCFQHFLLTGKKSSLGDAGPVAVIPGVVTIGAHEIGEVAIGRFSVEN